MPQHEHYLPIVLAALAVLIVGCWNPIGLRAKDPSGTVSQQPSYMWLALFAFIVGALTVWGYQQKKGGSGLASDWMI